MSDCGCGALAQDGRYCEKHTPRARAMTPAEKLEEIVRALEDAGHDTCAMDVAGYCTCGWTERQERALTLARELRDNAVEGGVQVACPGGNDLEGDPYECDPPTWHKEDVDLSDWECGACGATVDGRYGRKFIVSRALLITDPTP